MSSGDADPCPSHEVLGKFLEGTLTDADRLEVIRHLSGCAECRFVVESAADVMEESSVVRPLAAPERRFDWRLPAAVAAVAVLVLIGAATFLRQRNPAQRPDAIARLIAAMPSTERSIEPRLSGFHWAPLRDVRRGDATKKSPAELIAAGAAGEVLRDLDARRSVQETHAAGVAYLVAGEPKKATALLGQAAAGDTADAQVWTDFCAALYSEAAARDDSAGLQRALDAANRAIVLNAHLAEPHFNRALVLERMGRKAEAEQAWRDYLARDGASEWAQEAAARLARLQRQSAV